MIPLSAKARVARRPSQVSGSLTTTLGAMEASLSPSLTMVSKSVATASAEIGPLDQGADFGDDLGDVATRLGDQARIGGDAVHHPGGQQVLDDGDVGGVEKEFHGTSFSAEL